MSATITMSISEEIEERKKTLFKKKFESKFVRLTQVEAMLGLRAEGFRYITYLAQCHKLLDIAAGRPTKGCIKILYREDYDRNYYTHKVTDIKYLGIDQNLMWFNVADGSSLPPTLVQVDYELLNLKRGTAILITGCEMGDFADDNFIEKQVFAARVNFIIS